MPPTGSNPVPTPEPTPEPVPLVTLADILNGKVSGTMMLEGQNVADDPRATYPR